MMRMWRVGLWIAVALVLIAGAASIGVYAYNAGLAQGLAQSGELSGPITGVGPVVGRWYAPWGYGFGFVGCLFPLLLFLLFFGLLRGMFWGRRWGWRGSHGPWGTGVPPKFDEWHRKSHGSGEESGEAQTFES